MMGNNLGFSLLSVVFAITLVGVIASISMQRYLAVADTMKTLSKTQQFLETGAYESLQVDGKTPQARLSQLKLQLGDEYNLETQVIERDGALFLQIPLGRAQQ